MKIIVQDSQNVFDIAIQFYGSIEALPLLLEDNGLVPDDVIEKGTELIIQEDIVFDKTVLAIYKRDGVVVATGSEAEGANFLITEDGSFLIDEEENYLMHE